MEFSWGVEYKTIHHPDATIPPTRWSRSHGHTQDNSQQHSNHSSVPFTLGFPVHVGWVVGVFVAALMLAVAAGLMVHPSCTYICTSGV